MPECQLLTACMLLTKITSHSGLIKFLGSTNVIELCEKARVCVFDYALLVVQKEKRGEEACACRLEQVEKSVRCDV